MIPEERHRVTRQGPWTNNNNNLLVAFLVKACRYSLGFMKT